MVERFIAAVLKTVDSQGSGGSNPSFSAIFILPSPPSSALRALARKHLAKFSFSIILQASCSTLEYPPVSILRKLSCASLILCSLLMVGCASDQSLKKNPDPYESFNRKVFAVNDLFVRYAAKPVVSLYEGTLPQGARNGIQSFFENIRTISALANDVLQLNPRLFVHHTVRLVLNTTLGIFGFVDVASQAGFKPIVQSFGLTLAGWGYESSAYLVLPFYGPSTVRDGLGVVPDYYMSPLSYVHPDRDRYALLSADLMQTAAQLVPRYDTITNVALDPYIGIRNAYLQRQKALIEQIKLGGLEIEFDLFQGAPPLPAEPPLEIPPTDEWADLENAEEMSQTSN